MVRNLRAALALVICAALLLAGCADRKPAEEAKKNDDPVKQEINKPAPAVGDAAADDESTRVDGRSVRSWITQLQDGDVKARIEAAQTLGQAAIPRQSRELGKVVRLDRPNLTPTETDAVVSALGAAFLKERAPKGRDALVLALQQLGPRGFLELAVGIKSTNKDIRAAATTALCQAGSYRYVNQGSQLRKLIPPLVDLLKDDDPLVRRDAANALRLLGEEAAEALPALLTASKAEDEGGQSAREALRTIPKARRSLVAALLPFLKDSDANVRLKVVTLLCDLNEADKECLAALLELVKRRDPQIRMETVQLLYHYGSAARDAVPTLIEILRNDSHPTTRNWTINTLGAIGPDARAAIPVLKAIDDNMQSVAKIALKKIEQ